MPLVVLELVQARHPTRAFYTSALNGEGIEEAMQWLTTHVFGK